jgi:hypothetical protein
VASLPARYRTEWSNIGADSVVTVTSTVDQGDSMTIRISDDGALLDVNGANAIEADIPIWADGPLAVGKTTCTSNEVISARSSRVRE